MELLSTQSGRHSQIIKNIQELDALPCQVWPVEIFQNVIRMLPPSHSAYLFLIIFFYRGQPLNYYQFTDKSVVINDLPGDDHRLYKICCAWLYSIGCVYRPNI